MVELAVICRCRRKSTYYLEGDGPVFSCYEKLMELKASVRTAFYPNTTAIIDKLAYGNPT